MKKMIGVLVILAAVSFLMAEDSETRMPLDPVTGVIMVLMDRYEPGIVTGEISEELKTILDAMLSSQIFSFKAVLADSTVTLIHPSDTSKTYTANDARYAKALLHMLGFLNGALAETSANATAEIASAAFRADCSQAQATKSFVIKYSVTWKNGKQASVDRTVKVDELKPRYAEEFPYKTDKDSRANVTFTAQVKIAGAVYETLTWTEAMGSEVEARIKFDQRIKGGHWWAVAKYHCPGITLQLAMTGQWALSGSFPY
ncbi:MAG: hypothetical protein PHW04_17235 [Candidatus Wallbacteria bacterium]|nr:hypothetical protein [Candidatus Wallbacteria bacterium]